MSCTREGTPHESAQGRPRRARQEVLAGRSLLLILWLGSFSVGSACRTNESFDNPPSERVASSAPLNVTLSNELRGLAAKAEVAGSKIRFRVGNLLGGLFDSSDGRAFLSLVDSQIDIARSASGWASEYRLVVALQKEGSYYLIQGSGNGDSEEGPRFAGRLAVERCVGSVHDQLAGLLLTTAHVRSGR